MAARAVSFVGERRTTSSPGDAVAAPELLGPVLTHVAATDAGGHRDQLVEVVAEHTVPSTFT